VPSLKQIRVILDWLVHEKMIEVHPLRACELSNWGRPTVSTRAYVGIKIVVVNFIRYQSAENYKGRDKGRPSREQGHNNNNGNKEKDILSDSSIPYEEIIAYLNKKTGKHFRATTKETQRCISARWKDFPDLEAFHFVIRVKCAQWLNDPHMEPYLRPQTIFGTKFESYLNETMPKEAAQ